LGTHAQTPGPPFAPLHEVPVAQLPQETVPPQPSAAEPQLLVPQAWVAVFGVQTQVPGLPLQEFCAAVQVPQLTVPPQPSEALPQVFEPQAAVVVLGTQQVPAEPESPEGLQEMPVVQLPQLMV
jgi:hypothetical protein